MYVDNLKTFRNFNQNYIYWKKCLNLEIRLSLGYFEPGWLLREMKQLRSSTAFQSRISRIIMFTGCLSPSFFVGFSAISISMLWSKNCPSRPFPNVSQAPRVNLHIFQPRNYVPSLSTFRALFSSFLGWHKDILRFVFISHI